MINIGDEFLYSGMKAEVIRVERNESLVWCNNKTFWVENDYIKLKKMMKKYE